MAAADRGSGKNLRMPANHTKVSSLDRRQMTVTSPFQSSAGQAVQMDSLELAGAVLAFGDVA